MEYITFFNSVALLVCIFAFLLSIHNVYKYSEWSVFPIALCQTFFQFELVNIIMKQSKSKFLPTFMQNFTRSFIIWYVCYLHIYLTKSNSFYVMTIVWYIADIIRYVYYLFKDNKSKWLRYNGFIVLYPTGAFLEVVLTYYVYIESVGLLRNVLFIIMLLYIPGFPFLYFHMWKQRSSAKKKKIN